MVAAELNIAPKKKGAAAPAKPAATVTPTQPALKKGILPTGTSRTTVPVATQPAIDAKIKAKGVKAFTLEIVGKDEVKAAKVVGNCEGGAKRITYKRG